MNEGEIDVSNINPADLLAGLYNRSRPQGMGFLQSKDGVMTPEQAQKELEDITGQQRDHTYFDYLHGRVMKVEINGKVLEPRLYDRDLGQGAAQKVVDFVSGKTR